MDILASQTVRSDSLHYILPKYYKLNWEKEKKNYFFAFPYSFG